MLLKFLTDKLTGKRPLTRLNRRLDNYIRMNLKEKSVSIRGIGLVSAQKEGACECSIEPPGYVSYGVS